MKTYFLRSKFFFMVWVISWSATDIRDHVEETLTAILDRQVHKLRSKELYLVKMLWRNHPHEEATSEIQGMQLTAI